MDGKAKSERKRFREHAPEVGLLLWAVWNPIGVDVPLDEYDGYVPMVWKLLAEHAEVDEIARALEKIADERMGGGLGTSRVAAERLSQWWYWRFEFPVEFESAH